MVSRVLVGALLSALFLPAHASRASCGLVPTSIDADRAYPTVVDAVFSMQRRFLDESIRSDREFVGAILEVNGAYRASVGRGCVNQDTVTFAISVPPGARLAALWHTHGAPAELRELFSPDDVDVVRSMQCDFYLITPRGDVRVLRVADVARGVSMVRGRVGAGVPNGSARGDSVVPPRRGDARLARGRTPLPSDSRGEAPIG